MVRSTRHGGDGGFTLIELLVVMVVIGILAAIAIPAFTNQKRHAYRTAAFSDVAHAAELAQSYAVGNGDDFSGLEGATESSALLTGEGLQMSNGVTLTMHATSTEFCIIGQNSHLSGVTLIYRSDTQRIVTSGATCT